ncbi:MAG: SAM-dependent methyltransferase, partial [Ectothiorhodospiraceae bacterium]
MAGHNPIAQEAAGLPGLTGQLYERVLGRLTEGTLDVAFPDGRTRRFGNNAPPHAELRLHRPARLLWRLTVAGDVGFAEGYIDGDWETRDLTALLTLFTVNEAAMEPAARPSLLSWLGKRLRHRLRSNTRFGSRRN